MYKSIYQHYFASFRLFVNAITKHNTMQMMHAILPFIGTAPATTSCVSGFKAVPLAASPRLWHSARAYKHTGNRNCRIRRALSCNGSAGAEGQPPARTAANPTAYIPRIFQICSECAITPGVSNPNTKRPVATIKYQHDNK